jgi:hypothetical protein
MMKLSDTVSNKGTAGDVSKTRQLPDRQAADRLHAIVSKGLGGK